MGAKSAQRLLLLLVRFGGHDIPRDEVNRAPGFQAVFRCSRCLEQVSIFFVTFAWFPTRPQGPEKRSDLELASEWLAPGDPWVSLPVTRQQVRKR